MSEENLNHEDLEIDTQVAVEEETSNAAATNGWSVSRKPQPGDVTTQLLPTNRKG